MVRYSGNHLVSDQCVVPLRARLMTNSYVCLLAFAGVAVHRKRRTTKQAQAQSIDNEKSQYSFSTIPASSITIPDTLPSYRSSYSQQSQGQNRISRESEQVAREPSVDVEHCEELMDEKHGTA